MFSEGLFNYLATNTGIKAQLGTSRSDKLTGVFPQLAPDGPTYPYIVITQISGVPIESMEGMNRLTTARMRLSCVGSQYGQAKKLAEAVRQAFGTTATYQGTLTDGTKLQSASIVPPGEVDDIEVLPHGRIFSSHIDFEFQYLNEA